MENMVNEANILGNSSSKAILRTCLVITYDLTRWGLNFPYFPILISPYMGEIF